MPLAALAVSAFILWMVFSMGSSDQTAEMLRGRGFPCYETIYVSSWGEDSRGFSRYIDCADGNRYVQEKTRPLTTTGRSSIRRLR